MGMKYKISVVIPNYNGLELLQKNLPSVIAETKKYDESAEIIVVDDASSDGSVSYIKRNFPKVKLLKHSKNRGFSSAVNSGVKISKGDLLVFLNTDVSPKENYLINITKHFLDKNVFAVSFHEEGYGWARGYFRDGFIGHETGGEGEVPHLSFWVNGGSGVFRKKYFRELGGFDAKLYDPFYWEDVDISYRAMKRGYRVLWEPEAKVIHKHESTMVKINKRKRNVIMERNQLLFIWKNITSKNLMKKHVAGLFKRLSKHPGYIKVVFSALCKLKTVRRERIKEYKESKVSDEVIFASFNY